MLQKKHIFTDKVKTFIIDEADEMFSQGFQELIHNIFVFIPKSTRGVGLFSATFPNELIELTDKFMNNPERILVNKEQLTLEVFSSILYKCKTSSMEIRGIN